MSLAPHSPTRIRAHHNLRLRAPRVVFVRAAQNSRSAADICVAPRTSLLRVGLPTRFQCEHRVIASLRLGLTVSCATLRFPTTRNHLQT